MADATPADRAIILHAACAPRGGLIATHLQRLRAATATHANRTLHADQLLIGLLLAFFDPLARSLRTIEDHGDFGGRLPGDLTRLARSTAADALAAFDPALLRPIVDDLRDRLPPGLAHDDPDLATIMRQIIAADGTYLNVLADVAWALRHTTRDGRARRAQVRANVQLDTATWVPQVVSLSGDDGESEPAAFARDLRAGVVYVVDRNFVDFGFLRAVLDVGSDVVLRVKGNAPAMRVVTGRPLTAADAEAGVVGDELVMLTGDGAPANDGGGERGGGGGGPAGAWRLVTIVTTDRHGKPETIRLLTNLTDRDRVAARVVGAIYRRRWQVELFFKWLKTWARMDHLLSTSRRGVQFQLYVAVIGVLLMYAHSGRRVSLYALVALGRLARGECTLDEAMAVIARRDREREMARARQARRRAQKKLMA